MRRLSFAIVALALAPIPAQARTPAEIDGAESLRGSPVIPIILIAAILAGIILATSGDKPQSP